MVFAVRLEDSTFYLKVHQDGPRGTNAVRMSGEMTGLPDMHARVKYDDGTSRKLTDAMPLHLSYLRQHLDQAELDSLVEYLRHTAEMRLEINNAVKVIGDVFSMAKTAGQIKRMVPELLQYLPAGLRAAYDEQKRASSMPFEWAPYPKSDVERMILTISKGHLLTNMAKPGQENWTFEMLDRISWGAYADIAVA